MFGGGVVSFGMRTAKLHARPFSRLEPAVRRLERQAEEAGVRLTPGMAEGLARGNARMIAYVADLIALRGLKPAVQPRYDGGPVQPGQAYTGNEHGPEGVVTGDGVMRPLGDGSPGIFTPAQAGVVVPHAQYVQDAARPATPEEIVAHLDSSRVPGMAPRAGLDSMAALGLPAPPPPPAGPANPSAHAVNLNPMAALGLPGSPQPPPEREQRVTGQAFGPPTMDDTPATPGSLRGPMPMMPRLDGYPFQSALESPEFGEELRKKNAPATDKSSGDMATEWDGDPWAYGPPEHPGHDSLKDAKDSDGDWVGVLTSNRNDKSSAPVLQQPGAPNPGGYISTSSLHADWTQRKDGDPRIPHDPRDPHNKTPSNAAAEQAARQTIAARRKADELPGYFASAVTTPFIAVPFQGTSGHPVYAHGTPGDFVTVVDNHTGRYIHGIVADSRKNPRSEASVSVSRHFGLGDEGTEDKKRFSYFVYKGSNGGAGAKNWPLTNDQIHEQADLYRRMDPAVQAAIDAGYARQAAQRPATAQLGSGAFDQAGRDIDDFGRLPPPRILGWRDADKAPTVRPRR